MLKNVEIFGIQRKSCIQRHSKIFAFSRNPAFNGKGFLPFTANRKNWHSVKIRQRIPCGFYSAEFLAFSGNPQTIPFIFKNLKIFGIQRKLRGQGGRLLKKMKQKPKNALQTMFCQILFRYYWQTKQEFYIFFHSGLYRKNCTPHYTENCTTTYTLYCMNAYTENFTLTYTENCTERYTEFSTLPYTEKSAQPSIRQCTFCYTHTRYATLYAMLHAALYATMHMRLYARCTGAYTS